MKKLNEFHVFLKKKRAYRKFVKNCKSITVNNHRSDYTTEDPQDYLASAFIWEESPEGFYFWHNMENKWLAQCETK